MAYSIQGQGSVPNPNLDLGTVEKEVQVGVKPEVQASQGVNSFSLGFGSNSMLSYIPVNRSNGDAVKLTDKIKAVITANHRPGFNFNVDLVDNVNYELAYSLIVVSSILSNKTYYYSIVLESTGKGALTAEEITKELQVLSRDPYNTNKNIDAAVRTATPQDANDATMHNIVREYLSTKYGSRTFVNVNGLVLPNFELDLDNVAYNLANSATKAIIVENLIIDQGNNDVNITSSVNETKGKLEYEISYQSNNMFNAVGNPIRTDFLLKLGVFPKIDQVERRSINVIGKGKLVTEVGGYVEVIPEEVQFEVPGRAPVMKTVLKPNIVGTLLAAQEPTPSNLLLCVASLKVMADKNMYIPALNVRDANSNVGNLNIYTNINNTQLGQGQKPERLDLSSPELTSEQTYQILNDMFSEQPSISVDIEAFGPDSYLASILYDAASGVGSGSLAAAKDIVAAATLMTNGNFPADFDPNKIFIGPATILPAGYIAGKSDIMDIRTIDLAYFSGLCDDDRLLNEFVGTNLPYEVSEIDSYTKRIELISRVCPSAKITGKIARVTFTSEFLNALDEAIKRAGLVASYRPTIVLSNTSLLPNVHGYFNSSSVQGSRFANQFVNVRQSGWSTGFQSGFYRGR